MKTNCTIILFLLFTFTVNSQKKQDSILQKPKVNRWTLEFGVGTSEGIRPYTRGYYSTKNEDLFGQVRLNSFVLGAKYDISNYLGFKLDVAFDRFINKDDRSLPFEVAQYRSSIQGLVNLNRLFEYKKDLPRLKVLFHTGINVAALKTIKTPYVDQIGGADHYAGVVIGFTPMVRVFKKTYFYFDYSFYNNFRQHHTWDGNVSSGENNLSGQMVNATIGFSHALGTGIIPDRKKDDDKNVQEFLDLQKRVGDLETMMNDTDKDGVPDYLDSENNSVAGVAVNTRGVMIDINKNGVPDELERYLQKNNIIKSDENSSSPVSNNIASGVNGDSVKKSINDGYISAFFDVGSAKLTRASLGGISFILTYLRNNPEKSIDIIGHSDQTGSKGLNEKLSLERANTVKKAIVRSGIDASRLNVISAGIDTTADSNSDEARSLVRRVTFKIK